MGISITLLNNALDIEYNNLTDFLDQDKGQFVLSDFVEMVRLKDGKGIGVKNTFGKMYFFTVVEPTVGQMTPVVFRGQNVLALPVANWQGKPVASNEELYNLMRTCVN